MQPDQEPPSRPTLIVIGLGTAAAGLYFILISVGALPVPGGPASVHGPLWIGFCAGLAFLIAGVAVASRALAGDAARVGELPADAPRRAQIVQHLSGMAMGACLASIGTWIAIGPGPRSFNVSTPLFSMTGAEMFGRIAFGLGALICWFYVVAVAARLAHKVLRRSKA